MPRVDLNDMATAGGGHVLAFMIPVGKQNYRYQVLDMRTVHVFKSPDALTPTYVIKDGICSCPAAMHGKRCKHVAVVHYEPAG